MDQFENTSNTSKGQTSRLEHPVNIVLTMKDIFFAVSAIATVVCMCQNWCSFGSDIGIIDTTMSFTIFTLPEVLSEVYAVLAGLSRYASSDIMSEISIAWAESYLLMLLAICTICCYCLSIILRILERANLRIAGKINADNLGKVAAVCAMLSAILFLAAVSYALAVVCDGTVDGTLMQVVAFGPCGLTILTATISLICTSDSNMADSAA